MDETYYYILESPAVSSTWGIFTTREQAEAAKRKLVARCPQNEGDIRIIVAPLNPKIW